MFWPRLYRSFATIEYARSLDLTRHFSFLSKLSVRNHDNCCGSKHPGGAHVLWPPSRSGCGLVKPPSEGISPLLNEDWGIPAGKSCLVRWFALTCCADLSFPKTIPHHLIKIPHLHRSSSDKYRASVHDVDSSGFTREDRSTWPASRRKAENFRSLERCSFFWAGGSGLSPPCIRRFESSAMS